MISGVIRGVVRPAIRATLSTGGGAPAGFEFVTALNASGVRETVTAISAQGVRERVWARKAA